MAIAAAPSISLDGICCSTSYGINRSWSRTPSDGHRGSHLTGIRFGCKSVAFGMAQFHWLPVGYDLCPSKVMVASDYSGSVPESSNYMENQGYHPLEELKSCKRIRDTKLTAAEIARTAVEANSSALLVFPGTVHCEPHQSISWAEFHYVVDDFGDIFFEIFDDENILRDPGANNPVNAFIAMDIPMHQSRRTFSDYYISDSGSGDDISSDEDYFLIEGYDKSDRPMEWAMPEKSSLVHPIYFAKCLTKALSMEYGKKMDHPSNGVSIMGCLRPTFVDEEPYLRTLFHSDDRDDYSSDCKDGEIASFGSSSERKNTRSILYRLEIMQIELYSVYGFQSLVSLQDFQEADPDILVHSTSAIVEHFNEKGINCNAALKALCKRKGFHVQGANLIGVDSLGIDVRVFSGAEVQTHRFPFKIQANSEGTAAKQIQQLLLPRSRRKKLNCSHREGLEGPICW